MPAEPAVISPPPARVSSPTATSEAPVPSSAAARWPLPVIPGRELARRSADLAALRPLLLVADFDGTLARLVMDPWGATVVPGARRALRRIAGTPGVHVALLSGRIVGDLAARTRVGGAIYLGNHGVERALLPRGGRAESLRPVTDGSLAAYEPDAERLAVEVARSIPEPWLIVERKGPSVAFHFRSAPDVPAARLRVLEAIGRADAARRFVRFPGRRIVELRPPGAAGKRDTLRSLVDELRPAAVFMLGDDAADAEAFLVLRELRDGGRLRGLAIAVQAQPEMPDLVAASADVALASPDETARFLSALASRPVRPRAAPSRRPPRW